MKNYYAILGVPVGGSLEEIRQAYRRRAQENLDNPEAFAELKEAHAALTSTTGRAEYDLQVWGEIARTEGSEKMMPPLEAVPDKVGQCPMGAEEHCPALLGRSAATDQYCPECGYLLALLRTGLPESTAEAEMPQIRLEEEGGRSHPLRLGSNLVGREVAEVLLPDKTVSRQHARLEVIGAEEITLEDLSSTNGTQVNDQLLVPHIPRRLASGDQIRFGSILTTLSLPEIEPPPEIEGVSPAPLEVETGATFAASEIAAVPTAAVRATLREMREPASDETEPLEVPLHPGVTSFGRRSENTVVLLGDPYVSGSHAQIVADGDVFRLVDVGSTNGTLINGNRLTIQEPVLLSSGDLIVIGGIALRFEPVSAEESIDKTQDDAPAEILSQTPLLDSESPAFNSEPIVIPEPAVPREG